MEDADVFLQTRATPGQVAVKLKKGHLCSQHISKGTAYTLNANIPSFWSVSHLSQFHYR